MTATGLPPDREADAYLARALRLATRGRYRVSPNPMVGAVVVRDGEIVGEGWHRELGGAHAEVEALKAAGDRAEGSTCYVTLEPCAHHGRTPPCVEALIAAGVARVVACHRDPNPEVTGHGLAALERAGVEVEVGRRAAAAATLNVRFLVNATERRPAVTLKWAMSLDGKIATSGGESQWISSPSSRRWALSLREEHDAVLVGSGTALADDPRLDRRLGRALGGGVRVVLDRRLRLSPEARMLAREGAAPSPAGGPVLVYTRRGCDPAKRRDLEAAGAVVVALKKVEPATVLADLWRRDLSSVGFARERVRSVLVEGGAEVLGSFAAAGAFDEVRAACAPMLLGGDGAPGPFGGPGAARLSGAARLEGLTAGRRGPDLILSARRYGCLPALLSNVGE